MVYKKPSHIFELPGPWIVPLPALSDLLRKIQISISDAHFSTVDTEADFFNRIGRFRPVSINWFWLFFAIAAVFFEQVYPQENVHAEIDEGGKASLEGYLSTIRTLDQHFLVIP